MKAKLLTRVNALITLLMGVLGFSSCESHFMGMYGVPSGNLTFEGKVVNEEQEALPDVQIVRRGGWKDDIPQMYWEEYADTLYTNSEGEYYREYPDIFPLQYQKITATDPSGIYESTDTIVTVEYKGGQGWYEGKAALKVDFVLKKK